jgi:carbonic anhydrase
MTTVATQLTQRNADFAAHRFATGLRLMPRLKTIIIACVDPRVEPSDVLGVELGEAAVIRNVGGRVTPALLRELVMLRTVTQVAGGELGPGWELIVLHHTDCGITRLEHSPELLATFFDTDEEQVAAKAITDPRASVAIDVAALKAEPSLPGEIVVTGLVYDVATGHIETILAPSFLRT